jgi:spore germination cell wall hydrolase CwlJ-like protein
MKISVTALFKAISLVFLLCIYTDIPNISAKTLEINALDIQTKYEKAKQKYKSLAKQEDCLTKNVYYEAGSEPFEGKIAVAQVTMNRVESGRFASSVCGVVYQKDTIEERTICQFSWFCENYINKPVNKEKWAESKEAARKVLFNNVRLAKLENALYFHNDQVTPKWGKRKVAKIGRHTFYAEKRK